MVAIAWPRDRLPELVRSMASRPRHEALRGLVTELLREGFGADTPISRFTFHIFEALTEFELALVREHTQASLQAEREGFSLTK